MDKPPIPQPPLPVQSQGEVANTKPKSNFPIIVALFIIFVGGMIGAYYVGKKSSSNTASQAQNVKTALPSPSPLLLPTSTIYPKTEWKKYIHPQAKFSFEYPSDWKLEYLPKASAVAVEPYIIGEVSLIYIGPNDEPQPGVMRDGIAIGIDNFRPKSQSINLKEQLIKYAQNLGNKDYKGVVSEITIGNIHALQTKAFAISLEPDAGYLNTYEIGAEYKDKWLFIRVDVAGDEKKYMAIFNHILSSFKFSD